MGWVRKLFGELQGNYGTRFLDMWRSGQSDSNGDDVGLQNAMALWAEKLAGFRDRPEAIRRALESLPLHPPTLPEFVALCRTVCPPPEHKALPAPALDPEVIAARKAEADAVARLHATVPTKGWAEQLRKGWLAGDALLLVQTTMASAALGERWHVDGGRRVCSPIEEEA